MSIIYKLEQHLADICSENKEYEDLLSTWKINKESYRKALEPITQNYAHFTEHGAAHSESIISNIELILGEENMKSLSPTDTWMILQAAYLHDIGMVLMAEQLEQEWTSSEFQRYLQHQEKSGNGFLKEAASYLIKLKENLSVPDFEKSWPLHVRRYTTCLIADFYRKRHGEISEEYISDMNQNMGISLEFNGLIQNRLVVLLGKIVCLHTRDQLDVMKLDYLSNGHNSDYIHPRFIAEMIRLGDLLDADNNRFNPYLCKSVSKMPENSRNHMKKHRAVRHILITPELIEFRADCENNEVYRETRSFVTSLINEMDFLTKKWREIVPSNFVGTAPRLGKTEILLNGSPDLNEITDLRFEISQEKAFEMIEGSNLYEDRFIFVREVIQNAMDACKIQLWRDLNNGKYDAWLDAEVNQDIEPFQIESKIFDNYPVKVIMKNVEEKWVEIQICDYGTGISLETIKQMCDVGTSYWGREKLWEEIDSMPLWMKPTAGFGIGLQSIFLLTDMFEITSHCKNEAIRATFESRKNGGYVQVTNLDKPGRQGTILTVRLPLKQKISFPFGGQAYQYLLQEMDPFGKKNLTLQYKILDVIEHYCGDFYFPVEIWIEDKEIKDVCQKTIGIDFNNWKKEEYYYQIGLDKISMELWDSQSCTYFRFQIEKFERGKSEILFKGMRTSQQGMYDFGHGISCIVDIYGLGTKESLTLNRKNLTESALKTVNELSGKAFIFFRSKILDIFLNMDEESFEEIWGKEEKEQELLNLWAMAEENDREKLLKKWTKRFEQVKRKIQVIEVKKEEGKLSLSEMPFYKAIKKRSQMICFFYRQSLDIYERTRQREELENLCERLEKEIDKIDAEYILADTFFYETDRRGVDHFVMLLDGAMPFYYMKEKEDEYWLCLEKEERKYLIRHLTEQMDKIWKRGWYEDSIRKKIPAIDEYKELAVKNCPFGITGIEFYKVASVISPLLATDEKQADILEKEEFINQIVSRKDYKRLLDFVFENQIRPKHYKKEILDNKYKQLIGEFYDVRKKAKA